MSHKTLLERVKPEVKGALEAFRVKYPNSVEYVEEQLKNSYFVNTLLYGVVLDLRSIIQTGRLALDLNHPWDWFVED